MKCFPVVVSLLFLSHEVHPHAFQLGSEAMAASQPVAPPGGFVAAVPLVKALGSPPSPSDLGLGIKCVHVSSGGLETGKSKDHPSTHSDAGWQMSTPPLQRAWRLNTLGLIHLAGSMCAPIWHMMPRLGGSGSGGGDFTYRIPPAWAPENEQNYCFRAWAQDLRLWLMLADLHPAQQVAAFVVRLGGAAREVVRSIIQKSW